MCGPQITGHTGNDGTIDNSLDSVFKSIELGADAFELDVRRDKKGNLVLSHNPCSQEGSKSYHHLAEVFEILKDHPGLRINCDLKEDNLPLELINLAATFGLGADCLILTGIVALPYIKTYPEILAMADIYMNAENILEDVFFQQIGGQGAKISRNDYYQNPWKHLHGVFPNLDPYIGFLSDLCLEYGVKGINLPFSSVTDDNVKDFKKNGIPVSVWTVNDEEQILRFLSLGVENLTTRYVRTAKLIRKNLYGF
ncbi:glycerophosphodiester phosphodiesterase [Treponema sp.]